MIVILTISLNTLHSKFLWKCFYFLSLIVLVHQWLRVSRGTIVRFTSKFSLLCSSAPQSAYAVRCRKTAVSLTKDDESIGLVIRGGVHAVKSKSRPLTVTYVRPGGAADRWVSLMLSIALIIQLLLNYKYLFVKIKCYSYLSFIVLKNIRRFIRENLAMYSNLNSPIK